MAVDGQFIQMYAGENKSLVVTVLNSDGTARDLTGGSSTLSVRNDGNGTERLAKTGSIATNVVTFTLAQADTLTLAGQYVWICKATTSGSVLEVVATGVLRILAS